MKTMVMKLNICSPENVEKVSKSGITWPAIANLRELRCILIGNIFFQTPLHRSHLL